MVPSVVKALHLYARDEGAGAAVELALCLGILTYPFLNVVDYALFAFDGMQVHNAAEMGAQAVAMNCDASSGYLPAFTNCTASNSGGGISASTALSNGIQESALGGQVSLDTSYNTTGYKEGLYCSTSVTSGSSTTYALVQAGSSDTDCSNVANATDPGQTPLDYISVQVKYTYTPLIAGVTVTSVLNTSITKQVFVEL
jgi:hypothetical protein